MKAKTIALLCFVITVGGCGGGYQGTAACEDGFKRFKARVEADVRDATNDELKAHDRGHDTWVKACDAYGEDAVNGALREEP